MSVDEGAAKLTFTYRITVVVFKMMMAQQALPFFPLGVLYY